MSASIQIVVLGGGVIGLSCALHLREGNAGARIAIVDRPTNAGIASRAAAGMLAPYAEFAEDSPLAELCRRSYERWPEFLRRFAPQVPLHGSGMLLPIDSPAERHRAGRRIDVLERLRVEHRVLAGDALRAAEAGLADEVNEALWVPGALVHPRRLHDALLQAARAREIDFIHEAVVGIDANGAMITALRTADSVLRCTHVVLATGAWSRATGELFGVRIPMRPIKGQVLTLAVPDTLLPRHTIHSERIYIAPRHGEGAVCGATMEDCGFDTVVIEEVSRELARAAAGLLPSLREAPLREAWTGLRPRTDDGLPVIRRAAEWQNVIVATGHFRNGILLTPITGEIVAGEFSALR